MRHLELFEGFYDESVPWKQFLRLWTSGESRALRYFWSKPYEITEELEKTLTEDKYTLYRGIKCPDEFNYKMLFGVNPSQTKPEHLTYKPQNIVSWTKSLEMAQKFANPLYDSFTDRVFDTDEVVDMGYEDGDMLGIGVVIECTIDNEDLICDLNAYGSKSFLRYDQREQEVIAFAKPHEVKVLSQEFHYFEEYI